MSKHGGSPASGIVGLVGDVEPAREGSPILAPEISKRIKEAQDRALQFERRRIALELLARDGYSVEAGRRVGTALVVADELIRQTGSYTTGVGS